MGSTRARDPRRWTRCAECRRSPAAGAPVRRRREQRRRGRTRRQESTEDPRVHRRSPRYRRLGRARMTERSRMPDARGRFGAYGGRYVPETLVPALERLVQGVVEILPDPEFQRSRSGGLAQWVGRPTPLTPAPGLGKAWRAQVWLKREDLAHTGAHKINNATGQALLARHLGARRVVAETGAGQHGVATAAACARVGLPCTVYMEIGRAHV